MGFWPGRRVRLGAPHCHDPGSSDGWRGCKISLMSAFHHSAWFVLNSHTALPVPGASRSPKALHLIVVGSSPTAGAVLHQLKQQDLNRACLVWVAGLADGTMYQKNCQQSGAVASRKPGSNKCKKYEATDIGTRRMDRELKGTWSKKSGLHGFRAKVTLTDHMIRHDSRSPPSSVGRAQGSSYPCGRGLELHGGCCAASAEAAKSE